MEKEMADLLRIKYRESMGNQHDVNEPIEFKNSQNKNLQKLVEEKISQIQQATELTAEEQKQLEKERTSRNDQFQDILQANISSTAKLKKISPLVEEIVCIIIRIFDCI